MSTNNSGEWVKEGTPDEDWDSDTDYGVEIDPSEWDDYSDEQAVPVHTPEAARNYHGPAREHEAEPVVAQEPLGEEESAPVQEEATPVGAAFEPPLLHRGGAPADEEPAAEQDIETTDLSGITEQRVRPRPSMPGDDARPSHVPGAVPATDLEDTPEPEAAVQPEPEASVEPEPEAAVQPETEGEATQEFTLTEEPEADEPPAPQAEQPEPEVPVAEVESEDSDATRIHDAAHSSDEDPFQRLDAPTEETSPAATQDVVEDEAPPASETTVPENQSAGAAGVGMGAAGLAALYRREDPQDTQEVPVDDESAAEPDPIDHPDQTRVIDPVEAAAERLRAEEAEEQARMARLQEQRDARDARLGVVPGSDQDAVRVIEKPVKRQADRFFGAFSMFALRTIVAAIIGVLGYQVLQDVDAATKFLEGTVIPEPRLVAWILGFGLVAIAVLLVLGLGARIWAGLLLAVAIASLATIRWGSFSIFQPGMEGFLGDRTLLTAGASLVIMAFGAGRFSIDGAIHSARQKAKRSKSE